MVKRDVLGAAPDWSVGPYGSGSCGTPSLVIESSA